MCNASIQSTFLSRQIKICNKIIIKNNFLSEAQNGFTEGKTTKAVLHDFQENIQAATEKKDKSNWNFL